VTDGEIEIVDAPQALKLLRARIRARNGRTLIGIDGILGSGKAQFADELAELLRESGITVIRLSMKDFMHPKEVRELLGDEDGLKWYMNSFNYQAFIDKVIEPLSNEGSGRYLEKYYDGDTDCDCPHKWSLAPDNSVAIVDGLFLHRKIFFDENGKKFWDISVWLEVPFDEAFRRLHESAGLDANPLAESNERFYSGLLHYLEETDPAFKADIVVDNALEFHDPID
jgi:uridine kinase